MKTRIYAFILVSVLFLAACEVEEDRSVGTDIIDLPIDESGIKDSELPVLHFSDTLFDAGKITQGELIYHKFPFTNTGEAPLVIASVSGSCGCTIPRSYPKGKIMPGERGEIEVEFNSDGKWGEQIVSIIVSANTVPAATQLLIKTEIVVPDNMKKNSL